MKEYQTGQFSIQSRLGRIRRSIQNRLQSSEGETIVETLVTMIILSLAVLMLTGAVVTAARVNAKADNTDTAFTVSGETTPESGTVTVTDGSGATGAATWNVQVYKTENDYIYYEPQ